jgi:amino acid permease
VSQLTLKIIAKAADSFKLYDYQALVETLTSHKVALVLEISIILYEIGVLIGLQVILGEMMPSIWSAFGVHVSSQISSKVSIVVLNFAVMTPLSLIRRLTTIQYVSLFAIVGIVYVTVLSFVEYPFFFEENKFDGIEYAHFSNSYLSSIPICILMFFGHSNVCFVQGELAETNLRRIDKVISRFVLSVLVVVLVLSFFSYMSTLSDTEDICLLREPPSSLGEDWAMIIGRIFMSFSVIAAVPVNVKPIRIAILNISMKEPPKLWV